MKKLDLFHFAIVQHYINDKTTYLNLMSVNHKFGKINEYLNQFGSYPPFDDQKLFVQKKQRNYINNHLFIYNQHPIYLTKNYITSKFIPNTSIDYYYLRDFVEFEKLNIQNLALNIIITNNITTLYTNCTASYRGRFFMADRIRVRANSATALWLAMTPT